MKVTFLTAVFSLVMTASLFADNTNVLNNDRARASYVVGMTLGANWKQESMDVDDDLVLRGLKDEQSGGPTLLTKEEMQATLRQFQQSLVEKQKKARAEQGAKNKIEGEAFLAKNKKQPGVVTLPDGLQYKVLTNGTGAMPASNSIVTVNYRGTFIDGTEFDSSDRAGHPSQFSANQAIRGWTEALAQMKVGSKWRLFIPPGLAYGEQGRRSIPPNSTLIFEVELLDTQTPPPPAPLTSDIIKVPSAAEMKNGAKIETIKQEDLQKYQSQSHTN
jgi:FKBP-type peptidyl-prolyl cis-trans isomerase FklB